LTAFVKVVVSIVPFSLIVVLVLGDRTDIDDDDDDGGGGDGYRRCRCDSSLVWIGKAATSPSDGVMFVGTVSFLVVAVLADVVSSNRSSNISIETTILSPSFLIITDCSDTRFVVQ
jgi:hypothetical protein